FGCAGIAGLASDALGELAELLADDIRVQRLVVIGTEDFRKKLRLELAEHDVAVGYRQRPAVAITGGARAGPGRVRADAVLGAVEMQDRAAARGDCMD